MQTQFNKSFANTDKNPPEDAIRNETISFVLSSHKKWNKATKVGKNLISLSNMLNILQRSLNIKKKFPYFI